MNTETQYHPHAAVIDQMGGSTAVAKILGYKPQRVQNWKYRGVPDAERLQMIYELKIWPEAAATAPEVFGPAEPCNDS